MDSNIKYQIPLSRKVRIGALELGDKLPVVIQSMANTDTNNLDASLKQCQQIINAGGQIVRYTTQGQKEVQSLNDIVTKLRASGENTPIVADVHFRADVADEAAKICDKVRVNPGNFTEKKSANIDFTPEEYQQGIETNRQRLLSFIDICKQHNTAVRIGVNHGSLSRRIMSRYGDTPEGMVESTLEFLRVCKEANFHNVVVSLKSSNTRLMVQAVRLLVKNMISEDLYYPVHLGVTESGDGPEGRIKSVVGIAALLQEGIGDTIRISLTEPPENEIPVAANIRELFPKPTSLPYNPLANLPWDPCHYDKPITLEINKIGAKNPPIVISPSDTYKDFKPDITCNELNLPQSNKHNFLFLNLTSSLSEISAANKDSVIILNGTNHSGIEMKNWLIQYYSQGNSNPIIIHKKYEETDKDKYFLKASGEFGLLLIDGLISGVWIENEHMSKQTNNWLSFYILQAARERTSVTDFIACPSCGRTLFNIQKVLQEVKAATGHLKGLKIAVMGCVVNGPGEMADADYGYIGAGNGKVSIYKGRTAIEKNVPETVAIQKLIQTIKDNNDWTNPSNSQ